MRLNSLVEQRLRDGGIVDFAVTMAAITNEIDHHIASEFRAIFRRKFYNAHNSVLVLCVYVKYRYTLPLRNIGSKTGGMFLRRPSREADQIIYDDVQRAAHRIGFQVRKIQRFRPNALSRTRRVAVHHNRHHHILRIARNLNFSAVSQAVASLLRAYATDRDRIYRFKMVWIR